MSMPPTWKAMAPAVAEVDAQGQHHNQRRNDDVAALGEVHLVFHHVAHAHRGDHAVQNQGHAADGGRGHAARPARQTWGEKLNRTAKHGRHADHAGIVDLGQSQNAGVFAIRGIGRRAEEGSQSGSQAVAQQRAVQARILR